MGELTIKERRSKLNSEVTILDLSGKVTIGDGSVSLRDKIRDLIGKGNTQIILNFQNEEITYTDSSGIGECVTSFTAVNKEGGSLKLLNMSEFIKGFFTATKLLTVFDCFDDEEEAVKSFS